MMCIVSKNVLIVLHFLYNMSYNKGEVFSLVSRTLFRQKYFYPKLKTNNRLSGFVSPSYFLRAKNATTRATTAIVNVVVLLLLPLELLAFTTL